MQRQQLLKELSNRIQAINIDHPLRVGIDGVDAAGKTILADELAGHLKQHGREVIRASIDGFHNPRSTRIAKGLYSPEGYYQDSFNHKALIASLLEPLGPGGNLKYRKSMFDFINDQETSSEELTAASTDILVMEGVFLFRHELVKYWDFKIFLDVSFETNLARALQRDKYLFGEEDEIRKRYMERYIPGQKIYLETVNPKSKSDVVIDNNDFNNPVVAFISENR